MFVAFGRRVSFIALVYLFSFAVCAKLYGTPGKTLYVAEDVNTVNKNVKVFNRYAVNEDSQLERRKRDVTTTEAPVLQKNISTWTTHLNDSHQQLIVHWVGEGSNVIICLARDLNPRNKEKLSPSALFISYDYGKNFTNKTESFRLGDTPDSGYAQLDKFFNHLKYPSFCVFVDSTNKKLYYTYDNGQHIFRSDLNFQPSELAFDEEIPEKYVILDKVDPNKKLYLTLDGGKTFKLIQSFVKTFYWSSGPGFSKIFYVERWKPDGTSTVFSTDDPANLMTADILFENAKDFQIKGDYMFVTKQSKMKNTLDLFISHQRSPFYKAEFETELDLRKFHIADVTDKRIFVSVMHTETKVDLYVSEISNNFTQYNFVQSFPNILCYFPDGNWKDSWLEDVTEDTFTDLYRVEGLKGIYIASKVDPKAAMANIGPEHVVSMITFDHGVTWSPIKPPTEDENGKPIYCNIENSCSLHLCQKFSQLYPVTSPPGYVKTNDLRSASIMSSKSAPGIIMATGVMGKSLKGIPGVYISRDAGLTWKRILKDYYFFNYGDHGGVLVAVKFFKSRGETRKILYSTNEGIDWDTYQFNADDLRIYGLMTEPGENTTTFTMFGSANEQHQWIIITIDLKNAFEKSCMAEDYKMWSPSPPNSTVSCVLGTKDTFKRRFAHSNCYNGIGFDRAVKKEVCECSRRDYECAYGFKLSGNECIRNKSVKHDPYAISKDCRPGQFYKRTKGYRKIDGDVCTISAYNGFEPDEVPCPISQPTEFMIVALRDKIASIDLSDNTTVYPVQNQKNIIAIEFDIKNNCIYWADVEVDKISRQCFNNGTAPEIVVDTELASIEGMALDWISNVLFFVDGLRCKIEAVRIDLNYAGRMRRTILDSTSLSKPRGIAVHPRAGYLFWTDWDRSHPSVSRSNLDGTNVKKLFGKPIVKWPNGITIDQMSERLYWVDAMEDCIASSDLEGKYFKRILWNDEKVSHPFALAVLKDKVYWDDWKAKSIFIADKDTGLNVITINDSFVGLMDLKVFAHFVQHGSNACSYKNTSCDALCLGGPRNTFSCLCPDGFKKVNGKCMCPNGMEPASNMTCPKKAGATCDPSQFTCKSGMCIESKWRCDGNNDCGDFSDEIGCPMCTPPMLSCDGDTKCYLPQWKCDGEADCLDLSDEKDCAAKNCTDTQFKCDNGNCVDKRWLCDGDNDCKDGSDERNCTWVQKRPRGMTCTANTFVCGNTTECIPQYWVCDGDTDCPNGEDEKYERCNNSTCAPYMFSCPSGKCIYNTWVCDGENDCADEAGSDELNCTTIHSKFLPRPTTEVPFNFPTANTTCLDWMFACENGKCVPYWWRCDGVNDCTDGSDEFSCKTRPTSSLTPTHQLPRCTRNQFKCEPGYCIPLSWVCDGTPDCSDGGDEVGCSRKLLHEPMCGPEQTLCSDRKKCIKDEQICDGIPDCSDKSDETHCFNINHTTASCPNGFLSCDDGSQCVPQIQVCNGHQDCYDGADEANCSSSDTRIFQFLSVGVDQSSINSTSFLISCWMAQQNMVLYSFLPSISNVSDGVWKNMTWTNDSIYRFTDLEPYTNYNVTFYIRDSKSNTTYPSMKFVNTTTGEGEPTPPLRVTVYEITGSRVFVVWDPPATPRGKIAYYTVHYTPPLPPIQSKTTSTNVTINGYFKPNHNYSFWVTASNSEFTSPSSEVQTLTFDEGADVDDLVNVSMSRPNASAVYLQWHKISGVEGYKIQVRPPRNYIMFPPITTKENHVTVNDLPPGTLVYIDIKAFKGQVVGGPFTIPIKTEGQPDPTLNLTAVLLKDKRTSVKLTWSPPKEENYKEIEYFVHYTNHVLYSHLGEANNNYTTISTKNTTLVIDDLNACEMYMFTVSLKGGPLSRYAQILTRENARAPIKDLHFDFLDEEKKKLAIKWHANCDLIREPVSYRLDIREETRNKLSSYELSPTVNVSLEHVIVNIAQGGRYNVCISASVENAMVRCARVTGGLLQAPDHVAAWLAPTGDLMVSWKMTPQDHKDGRKYEIVASREEIPEDSLQMPSDAIVHEADNSPVLLSAPAGSGQLFVGVRVLTNAGYYSELSEVHTLKMEEAEATWNASALWGLVGGSVAVLAVLTVVALFVLRARRRDNFLRLQRTPRYDTRRNHATIDDDDVPPIHGFSDDEPLVIA